jgi:SAM-dependent methyltransferase
MEQLKEKYDILADGFARNTYSNLDFYMRHRLWMVLQWKPTLAHGDRVMELGCGDGYLGALLSRSGLHYTGVDLSPRMVEVTRRRLQIEGVPGECHAADVSLWLPPGEQDAIISFMRTFCSYVADPARVLGRLAPKVRKKVIIDLDPRRTPVRDGIDALRAAGFQRVRWRPFLVPHQKNLPTAVLRALTACETIPIVRSVPIRWKFNVILQGDRR